jgi:3-oxoacyl-[acyl-carrier-protein] synthase II
VAIEALAAIPITGLGALSALGTTVREHHQSVLSRQPRFQALGRLLGPDSPHAARPGAWIDDRSLLTHRKWSPATMAALHVARQAITQAAWSASDLHDAALVVGTSRGNAAAWLGPWPGRRGFRLMAASNTIHSEPATAITIEFGITGPNHVLASGCSAGLDAIGIAMMLIRCGAAPRALAVAVDLPLVPMLLDNYAATGILADHPLADPYRPGTAGFIPAEGAAAMAMGSSQAGHRSDATLAGSLALLTHYGCNSDACDPIGIPKDGGRTPELFLNPPPGLTEFSAVCPHATGTAVQAAADPASLTRIFPHQKPTLHLLKPITGHTIGASGMLESVILASFLEHGTLPPNMPGLHAPPGFTLPESVIHTNRPVAKLSHGMGGHNALLVITPPPGNHHPRA